MRLLPHSFHFSPLLYISDHTMGKGSDLERERELLVNELCRHCAIDGRLTGKSKGQKMKVKKRRRKCSFLCQCFRFLLFFVPLIYPSHIPLFFPSYVYLCNTPQSVEWSCLSVSTTHTKKVTPQCWLFFPRNRSAIWAEKEEHTTHETHLASSLRREKGVDLSAVRPSMIHRE